MNGTFNEDEGSCIAKKKVSKGTSRQHGRLQEEDKPHNKGMKKANISFVVLVFSLLQLGCL